MLPWVQKCSSYILRLKRCAECILPAQTCAWISQKIWYCGLAGQCMRTCDLAGIKPGREKVHTICHWLPKKLISLRESIVPFKNLFKEIIILFVIPIASRWLDSTSHAGTFYLVRHCDSTPSDYFILLDIAAIYTFCENNRVPVKPIIKDNWERLKVFDYLKFKSWDGNENPPCAWHKTSRALLFYHPTQYYNSIE